MPVFKNEGNGTWYVMARYVNWKGERKQKCKRGFATKKEAQEWERMFQLQNSSDMDMSFEAFTELYIRDMKSRLKENTWLTKEHIIRTKILPYFGKLKISEISLMRSASRTSIRSSMISRSRWRRMAAFDSCQISISSGSMRTGRFSSVRMPLRRSTSRAEDPWRSTRCPSIWTAA